eukprot:5123245-Lingulodinium_polyedra.AAC.1
MEASSSISCARRFAGAGADLREERLARNGERKNALGAKRPRVVLRRRFSWMASARDHLPARR